MPSRGDDRGDAEVLLLLVLFGALFAWGIAALIGSMSPDTHTPPPVPATPPVARCVLVTP